MRKPMIGLAIIIIACSLAVPPVSADDGGWSWDEPCPWSAGCTEDGAIIPASSYTESTPGITCSRAVVTYGASDKTNLTLYIGGVVTNTIAITTTTTILISNSSVVTQTLNWLDIACPAIAPFIPSAQGDMIYANATPAWQRLALGSGGSILTQNGSNPVWSTYTLTGTAGLTLTTSLINQGGVGTLAWPAGGAMLGVPTTGMAALLGTTNIFTTNQTVNCNSTAALRVEQTGVQTNTLVVDTTNGRVAVGGGTTGFSHEFVVYQKGTSASYGAAVVAATQLGGAYYTMRTAGVNGGAGGGAGFIVYDNATVAASMSCTLNNPAGTRYAGFLTFQDRDGYTLPFKILTQDAGGTVKSAITVLAGQPAGTAGATLFGSAPGGYGQVEIYPRATTFRGLVVWRVTNMTANPIAVMDSATGNTLMSVSPAGRVTAGDGYAVGATSGISGSLNGLSVIGGIVTGITTPSTISVTNGYAVSNTVGTSGQYEDLTITGGLVTAINDTSGEQTLVTLPSGHTLRISHSISFGQMAILLVVVLMLATDLVKLSRQR